MTGPNHIGRLIILAGPSCSGKTPLIKAFRIHYPEEAARLQQIVPYTTRSPRAGELDGRDYHFIDSADFSSLSRKASIIGIRVRGDRQAVDTGRIEKKLRKGPVLYEGNTFLARKLLFRAKESDIPVRSIFLSPFGLTDLQKFYDEYGSEATRKHVYEIMLARLRKRARRKKFGTKENVSQRAREAFDELLLAGDFDFVIVNPSGEEDAGWDDPYRLSGSAEQVTRSFAEIVVSGYSDYAEKWPAILF